MMASDPVGLLVAHESASPATALELQRALVSWNQRCEEGLAALELGDLERVDAALAARDGLRPQIEALVLRMQSWTGAPPQILSALARLQRTASAAERRLSELLESERARLRAELDAPGRSGPHPYSLSESPRSRLDIRR